MQFLFLTQQPQLHDQISIVLPVSLRSKVMFRRLQSNSELLCYMASHIYYCGLFNAPLTCCYILMWMMLVNINHEMMEPTISSWCFCPLVGREWIFNTVVLWELHPVPFHEEGPGCQGPAGGPHGSYRGGGGQFPGRQCAHSQGT